MAHLLFDPSNLARINALVNLSTSLGVSVSCLSQRDLRIHSKG
jgi:hypothetical protein